MPAGRIRNHNPSNRVAVNQRLRTRDQRDQPSCLLILYIMLIKCQNMLNYEEVNYPPTPLCLNISSGSYLCQHPFFKSVQYNYENALDKLRFYTSCIRSRHLDAIFPYNFFNGLQSCSHISDIIGLRVATRNLRLFIVLFVC